MISVKKMEMFESAFLARKYMYGKAPILMLDSMISKVSCGL